MEPPAKLKSEQKYHQDDGIWSSQFLDASIASLYATVSVRPSVGPSHLVKSSNFVSIEAASTISNQIFVIINCINIIIIVITIVIIIVIIIAITIVIILINSTTRMANGRRQ